MEGCGSPHRNTAKAVGLQPFVDQVRPPTPKTKERESTMTTGPWYVDLDFSVSEALTEDVAFDVLDVLGAHSAAMSTDRDFRGGSVSFAIEAPNAAGAVPLIEAVTAKIRSVLGDIDVTRVDVMTEAARKALNEHPSIPPLVGYAEIADLAGVTRQRARELAHLEGFPVAVVETAAGPLRVKAAVESWIGDWDRKPGRPRKMATA